MASARLGDSPPLAKLPRTAARAFQTSDSAEIAQMANSYLSSIRKRYNVEVRINETLDEPCLNASPLG